jgi:hypothetical protein
MLLSRTSRLAIAAVTIGLALATSACASPAAVPAPSASPVAAVRTSAGTSSAVETECALVSAATSIMFNAAEDRRAGRLTATEYSAVLNTAPQVLLFTPRGLPGPVARAVHALLEQVGPATAGRTGPAFDPRGRAVLAALGTVSTACDANGTPTGVLATSGG